MTKSVQSSQNHLLPLPKGNLTNVGVFVDYKEGFVSFYEPQSVCLLGNFTPISVCMLQKMVPLLTISNYAWVFVYMCSSYYYIFSLSAVFGSICAGSARVLMVNHSVPVCCHV